MDPAVFGWASVQLDGGIVKAMDKVEAWFRQALAETEAPVAVERGLGALRLGMQATGELGADAAQSFAQLTRWVVTAGGTVVVPHNATLLREPAYLDSVLIQPSDAATLPYGQAAVEPGFYIMETPTDPLGRDGYRAGGYGRRPDLGSYRRASSTGAPLNAGGQVSANPTVAALYGDDIDLA